MRTTYVLVIIGLVLMFAKVNAEIDKPLVLEPIKTRIFIPPVSKNPQKPSSEFDGFVDYVLVKKAERKLYLYVEDQLVKSYRIGLGKQPSGHKKREGDSRTPEGLYTLDWRNPSSKFFRSIHVSYPNIVQSRNAQEAGVNPGGEIMIHGQPNGWSERIKLTFGEKDWTEGCIALENQDMIELWDLVRDGTPIKIDP